MTGEDGGLGDDDILLESPVFKSLLSSSVQNFLKSNPRISGSLGNRTISAEKTNNPEILALEKKQTLTIPIGQTVWKSFKMFKTASAETKRKFMVVEYF